MLDFLIKSLMVEGSFELVLEIIIDSEIKGGVGENDKEKIIESKDKIVDVFFFYLVQYLLKILLVQVLGEF